MLTTVYALQPFPYSHWFPQSGTRLLFGRWVDLIVEPAQQRAIRSNRLYDTVSHEFRELRQQGVYEGNKESIEVL
jgi:hypothetical protein